MCFSFSCNNVYRSSSWQFVVCISHALPWTQNCGVSILSPWIVGLDTSGNQCTVSLIHWKWQKLHRCIIYLYKIIIYFQYIKLTSNLYIYLPKGSWYKSRSTNGRTIFYWPLHGYGRIDSFHVRSWVSLQEVSRTIGGK
jgi:hypothetical protein